MLGNFKCTSTRNTIMLKYGNKWCIESQICFIFQRWTIGSNLEPDRSGPLELWRLRSAPEILEMELFGSDRLLETLRWSFGSDRLRLYWSCSIFYNILYPLESSLSSLRAEYDSTNIFGLLEIYIRGSRCGYISRNWLTPLCQLAGKISMLELLHGEKKSVKTLSGWICQ